MIVKEALLSSEAEEEEEKKIAPPLASNAPTAEHSLNTQDVTVKQPESLEKKRAPP